MALDKDRDTGRVILIEDDGSRTFLDFASYREGATLEGDLRARDCTINAIAYDIHRNTIIDPLNGAADLRAKLIRACSPASFRNDPVRILRAIRQAAAFEFKIELATRQLMKEAVDLLPRVSPERQRDELFKILEGPKPDASMRALEMLGVFPHLMPELSAMKGVTQSPPHIYDVWEHTLSVLRYLEGILSSLRPGDSAQETNDTFTGLLTRRLGRYHEQFAAHFAESLNTDRSVRGALFFAALYHDVAKPATRSVEGSGHVRFLLHEAQGAEVAGERAQAFNLSTDEVDRIRKIIFHHMRFLSLVSSLEEEHEEPSRRAIYRFFRDSGEAGVDLVLLGLADLRGARDHTLTQETWATSLDVAHILLESYWEKREETVSPPRLLDGNDLMRELNLPPGKVIGLLLEAIREAQATGQIATREQALDLAREELRKLDPS
jgi:tRNA nucleotidyltransferase/poly(A) polymerase